MALVRGIMVLTMTSVAVEDKSPPSTNGHEEMTLDKGPATTTTTKDTIMAKRSSTSIAQTDTASVTVSRAVPEEVACLRALTKQCQCQRSENKNEWAVSPDIATIMTKVRARSASR